MRENKYRFLELFGEIDEQLILWSCQPWEGEEAGQRDSVRETGDCGSLSNMTRLAKVNRKSAEGFRLGRAAACVAMVLILGAAGMFHQQVEAAIGSFTSKIAQILGIGDDLSSYTDTVNTSQTKEGVTVTLEEVILADNQFYAAVHLEWDDSVRLQSGMMNPGVGLGYEPKFNGEELMPVSSGNYSTGELEETHDFVLSYIYEDGVLPEKIHEIEMELRIYLTSEVSDEGIPFTYRFSASREELQKDTLHIPMGQMTETENGGKIYLKELVANKVFSRIEAECNEAFSEGMDEAEYLLLGTDSLGNQLEYEVSGGLGDRIVFESRGELPSADSRWIELQLYELRYRDMEIRQDENMGLASARLKRQLGDEEEFLENDNAGDDFAEDSTVYMRDKEKAVPVGEKFRIYVDSVNRIAEEESEDLVEVGIIGGADTPTTIKLR